MPAKKKVLPASELLQRVEQAHPNQQRLLQLLAITYQSVAAARLYACVNQLNIKDDSNRKYTHKYLQQTLEMLAGQGLLTPVGSQYAINPLIAEVLCRRAAAEGYFTSMAKAARQAFPLGKGWNDDYMLSPEQGLSEIRIAFYANKVQQVNSLMDEYIDRFYAAYQRQSPLYAICCQPFDDDWFSGLSGDMLALTSFEVFNVGSRDFTDIHELLQWLLNAFQQGQITQAEQLAFMCGGQFLLDGDCASAQAVSPYTDDYHRLLMLAWQQVIEGENSLAIDNFEAALALYKGLTRKRKTFINNISGIFYLLALIKSGEPGHLQRALDYSIFHTRQKQFSNPVSHRVMARLLSYLSTGMQLEQRVEVQITWQDLNSTLGFLLHAFYLYWTSKEDAQRLRPQLKKFAQAASENHCQWLAAEAWQLLARLDVNDRKAQTRADQQHRLQHTKSLIDIIRTKEKWEQALDAIALIPLNKADDKPSAETRIIWLLSDLDSGFPEIQPKEQKRTARGGWTKGRNVALKRLKEDPESFSHLCPQDQAVRRAIYEDRSYSFYGGSNSYELDVIPALSALAGHPLLFDGEETERQLELSVSEPEVVIRKEGQQLIISMQPTMEGVEDDVVLQRETASRWKLIRFSEQHRQLSSLLGGGIAVPADQKARVLETMSSIAPLVNIHSDIGGQLGSLETVEADSSLHVLLSPSDDGIIIEARSRVFGQRGPYYPPGEGSENLISEIDGKRLQTRRNLKQEREEYRYLLEACPLLAGQEDNEYHWYIAEAEDCLEMLTELQAIKDRITIAWPKGESMRIRQQVSTSQFKLQIDSNNDWFSASGELKLEDGEVLNMQRLLSLTKNARGRFIQLEDGQFLALSKTFQKRLKELNNFGEIKGDAVNLHPLAALTLEDMAGEVGQLKAGKHWKEFSQRFEQAMALHPKLPSTLQAELRDYQQQGFEWLVRLAHWGAGACLADDMGLGKTLQALAMILYRAMNGPSLVVAPTSVSLNWMDEIERFAPTLNIIDIRDMALDSSDDFQPFDIVISSYGLLQTRPEQLHKTNWQTIVLDEAQAIKNPATKRSQAAMKLQGKFKCITTGTPIENHLGELWNLFRFINPGLLGSLERFNERFALPISRDSNPDASQQLKRLIQPFILRRTKTQVLKELPARTEIVLNIEMSKEEARLYEALRREAIEKFAAEANAEKKGHRQLQILAEITRLRQVCCNPQLVMKQAAPASSKLAQFAETLQELLENHHKALVFSQFVGHLQILEQHLKDNGISYQYLDGSTPAKERKKRVNAFQAGEGDVFLISLKAGGVGLNLTAADYVIHMDPWWNPAVEDQASDRAHRIGQTRPVTVYRMVMKDTIEQKIIALHHQKRDLADNLLAGTDVADKLNAEDLLALLKED